MFGSHTLACLAFAISVGAVSPMAAQTEADAAATTTPDLAYFQDATIVGSNNSISITRLPVVVGGKTYYWDITLPFDVESDGKVAVGLMDIAATPALIVSAFHAGAYNGPSTILYGLAKIAVAGPGVWNGVYSQWTISAASGANGCTYPSSGAF